MKSHARAKRASRLTRSAVLVGAVALTLAACGGDSATPTPTPTPAPVTPTTPEPEEEVDPFADARAFFASNTVTLAVGSSAGGGYDAYARMLAPYLAEALGTTVVVDNETGGGGLLMINNAVIDARQDGTKLMILNGIGAASAALSGAEGVAFTLDGLKYVGMVAAEAPVLVVRADSPYQSIADLKAGSGILFGATGAASAANTNAEVIIRSLGLDATVATAFAGSSELDLALLAGDITMFTGAFDSRVPSIQAGETRALLIVDSESAEPLQDVANFNDLTPYFVPGGEAVFRAHLALTQFARPLATHPGIPEDRLAYLRAVFAEVMQNPALLAESQETRRPLGYRSGEDVEQMANELANAPEAYLEVLRATQG